MKLFKKILAIMLVVTMVITSNTSIITVLATETANTTSTSNNLELPYCIPEDEENVKNHTKRLTDEEDEYTAVFENADETITVYSFAAPIQYYNENGKLVDYDPRLTEVKNNDKKNAGYAYEVTSSDVNVLMPEDLVTNKYITIEKDKYKIDFKPIFENSNSEKVKKDKDSNEAKDKYKADKLEQERSNDKDFVGAEYLSPDSDDVKYKYYTMENGVKEDIILNVAPASNMLQFEIKVKGLILETNEFGNIFYLDDETKEIVGSMSPLFMYDSYVGSGTEDDYGPHETDNIKIELEEKNDNKYILTAYLDEEFLNSTDTVYPVTVDPTLVLDASSSSHFYDTYVYSSINKNYNDSSGLKVGRASGVYRSYIQPFFPSSYAPYEIVSASMRLYNVRGTGTRYIRAYRVTRYWNETNLCYSVTPPIDSTIITTTTVSTEGYDYFNIKTLAQGWADWEVSGHTQGYPNYGFMLKDSTEVGSYTYKEFCSEIYYLTYRRPYLTITYKQDNEAPDNVTWLNGTVSEDPVNNGRAVITATWPETTDNSSGDIEGVKEYELTLTDAAGNFYNADGTMTPASTPENYTPETIIHDDVTTTYSFDFNNLPDNTTYSLKVRACDDMSAAPLVDDHWSGYTPSDAIVVGDIEEVAFTISPNSWTDSQTPTITWSGIEDTFAVEYSIDGGAFTDSGYVGLDGSGALPSLGLSSDGTYQIKIRGYDTVNSVATPESSQVSYYYDNTAPTVDISSPSDTATIGESVDILGGVSDSASGVASWTLEYNDGSEPIAWNTIATGLDAVSQGQSLALWDTSALGVGDYTLRLTAVDNVGHNSVEESITLNKPVAYTLTTPANVSAVSDVNYMIKVTWDDGINPNGTTYAVYRGATADFTPSDDPTTGNLIADDVSGNFIYDYDVENYVDTVGPSYYYKVIASYEVGAGLEELSPVSAASNEGKVTVSTEVVDKLGLQDFWQFTSFGAGNGVGYINVANGNLVYNSTDSVFPGYMLAMVMRRTYNSQSDVKSALGYGWDFSYNTVLYKEIDGADEDIILKDGDGSLHYFQYYQTVSGVREYITPTGVFMELTYDEASKEYTIKRKDDVTYTFNSKLQLAKLSEMNGNYLKFNYDTYGKLISVENCDKNNVSKHQAYLTYYQSTDTGVDAAHIGLLKEMSDEAGRTYKYEYEAGNAYLKKVYLTTQVNGGYYGEEYTYAAGTHNLASVKDANNHTTSITYHAGAKVNTVTYPDSKYFTLSYATDVSKTLFDATSVTLNTTTVTDSWGHSSEYAYNSTGQVRVTTNDLGESTELDYNASYQVTAVRYQNYVGNATTLSTIETTIAYNTDNNITGITDAYGHTTAMTYDPTFVNKVATITVPMNATTDAVTTNTYYTDGNLYQTVDAEGNTTIYTYTGTGFIETVTRYVGGTASFAGSKTYYTYNADGWLDSVYQGDKDTANASLTLMSKVIAYDDKGNPTIVEDAMGNQSKVEYDILGRPTKTYLPDRDTQETTQNWTNNKYTTATYDLKGNVLSTTDIMGVTTNMAYDNMDRILSTTQVVSTGNIVNSVVYSDYTYNSTTCLKVTATNPEGVQAIEYYDELGRVIKSAISDGTTELDRSIVEYDRAGNVVLSKDMIESTTDYRETTIEYDMLNRQTEVYMYNDASQLVSTEYTYDYAGNTTSVIDPMNYTTSYLYDKLGRLTRVTQGYHTYYSYDNIKGYDGVYYLMNKITDAKGRVNETYLDEYGNAVVDIDQGDINTSTKRVVERTFNLDGSVATITQPDGQVDYYTYNNWGQVDLVRYGSSTSTDNQTDYDYNAHGQISQMTDSRTDSVNGGVATYTTVWTYDEIGRTTGSIQDGTTISYAYDKAGNITSLEQPTDAVSSNTEITSYAYNNYGQLESVYHNSDKIRDYTYSTSGELDYVVDYLKFDEGNTTSSTMTTDYTYTNMGQLSEIKYTNDTTTATLEKYNYTYDLSGNIKTETLYNTYGGTTNLTKTYTYDSLYRLTNTVFGSDETIYEYDSVNNRTAEKSRQGAEDEWYDKYHYYTEFDQLDYVTMNISNGAQTVEEYDYDARGAMTFMTTRNYSSATPIYDTVTDPDTGIKTIVVVGYEWEPIIRYDSNYYYDKAGYLQKSYEEVVNNTVYETTGHYYNGMEQRVRKSVLGGDTTKYIYAGSKLLFTTDGNNAKLTENILSPNGEVIAGQRFSSSYAGNYYFYNTDIRNSTMSILSETYSAVKYYKYNEYGEQTTLGNSSFINDMTYTGAVTEGGNIFYMNARFYDANNGRFLTQDTYKGNMWEPGSQNLYTYVGNNPINYVDPTGHNPIAVYALYKLAEIAITLLVGAIVITDQINHMQQEHDYGPPILDFPQPDISFGEPTVFPLPDASEAWPTVTEFPLPDPTLSDFVYPFTNLSPEELGKTTTSNQFPLPAFENIFTVKRDLKQVKAAAKQVGVDYNELSEYIHDLKYKEGKRGDDNFSYKELLELANELKGWSSK